VPALRGKSREAYQDGALARPHRRFPVRGRQIVSPNKANDKERTLIERVREFTEAVVTPIIEEYWARDVPRGRLRNFNRLRRPRFSCP
jgi:hypothetical protein